MSRTGRGRGLPPQLQVQVSDGDNRKMIECAMKGMEYAPVDTGNPEEINERLYQYLNDCCENDARPSVSGASLWLGVDERKLADWYAGRDGTSEHQTVAIRFYQVMKTLWNDYMQNNKINPVAGIYLSKVYYGYKETTEINLVTRRGADLSITDLIAGARALPGGDTLALNDGETTIE